jgi:hypothetical protein
MTIPEETLKLAIAWCRSEYRKRYNDHSGHVSHLASDIMEEAEKRFELPTHGVEGWSKTMVRGVSYLNTGDSYGRTILFVSSDVHTGRWSLGAWGDIAERESN